MGLDFYNIAGTVNTAFIFVSLYGVFSQLRTICRRKASSDNSVRPTELLSLNQFTVSYLAYLSFLFTATQYRHLTTILSGPD